MNQIAQPREISEILTQRAPSIIRGHSVSLHIWCPEDGPCSSHCQGGTLILSDISIALSCEQARNLADRSREAVDATILGCLPPTCGSRLQ